MKTYVLCLFIAACGALYCPTQLDAFKDLARRYYQLQNTPTPPPSPTTPQDTNGSSGEEITQENAPKMVQFAQRDGNKIQEFKQVEGANDGGEASTPDKNLAAWFSTPLFDAPTRASWLDDDNYDPDAIAKGWATLRKQGQGQGPRVKAKDSAAGGKVLNTLGSGGAASGGLGGAASAAQQENDMRQSLMQKGRAERAEADSSDASAVRAQARERARRSRQARQSWNATLANTRTSQVRGAFARISSAHSRPTTSTATQTSPHSPQISPRIRDRLLQFRSSVVPESNDAS